MTSNTDGSTRENYLIPHTPLNLSNSIKTFSIIKKFYPIQHQLITV